MTPQEPSDHSNRVHSIVPASAAERWLNCKGSVALSLRVPERQSSADADEGTRAHELGERILRYWKDNGRKLDSSYLQSLAPPSAKIDPWDQELTESPEATMLKHVMLYVETCIAAVNSFDDPRKVAIKFEETMVLDEGMGMFATPDFAATGNMEGIPTGVIIDLKYGKKAVYAERPEAGKNPQLAYYSCLLRKNSARGVRRVRAVVCQPRRSTKKKLSETWFETEDLDEWERTLLLGAAEALMQIVTPSTRQFQEGPWCWFCPARAANACEEYGRRSRDNTEGVLGKFLDKCPEHKK